MSSNKKSLKMERLSPIPALDRKHLLSDSLRTPVQRAAQPTLHRQKDAYAIETTSSPEFGKTPVPVAPCSSSVKQRRYRNITRGKIPKKPNSTPLSVLISRKTVTASPKETLHLSDSQSSPSLNDMPSPSDVSVVSISQDLPLIDDYSPQKPTPSLRHSEIISASTKFPLKSVPSTSNITPLAGIVNKKFSNLNRSLNDSILVLQEAEDPSDDDEELVSNTSLPTESLSEKVSIESFESPRKPRYVFPKENTSAVSHQKFVSVPSKNLIKDDPYKAAPVVEKSDSNSVEMCGTERKNRKRALDFNSSNFIVPIASDDVGSGRGSPILSLSSPSREPVAASSRDSQSPILQLMSPKSLILNVSPLRGEDCQSSIFNPKSPSHCQRDCQSPILNITPLCEHAEDHHSPILNIMSPLGNVERDFQSPVLNVTPFCEGVDCHSPILNLLSSSHDFQGDRRSPILNIPSPSREKDLKSPILELNPQPLNSLVLNPMSSLPFAEEAHLEPLKPTEITEASPLSIEKQGESCPSDTDSVIESTPRASKNLNQNLGSLTGCFRNENGSPPCTGIKADCSVDNLENPKIAEFLDKTSHNDGNCDLKFVVVSQDTSSDESDLEQPAKNACDVIDGRQSPHLELNYTRRQIQSFESPSKAGKQFSEAVNIGAFGSPDSNASYGDQRLEEEEKEFGTDEAIEPSTTQEYIEESEQIRPSKRRKKGSLLERVRGIIAKVDASNALFDYEMKCGLRPTKGKLVSAPLVILKKSGENSSFFLVCKPLKYCRNSSHVEDVSSFLAVHVNKLPPGIAEGSVVLLHFPLNVMYYSTLQIPCVLAGHQIVSHPSERKIDVSTIDLSPLESINPFSLVHTMPVTSFKTFSSVQLRTLTEAGLCQNLVEDGNLYLTVLHVTKFYADAVMKTMSVLCRDEEFQFCWLAFSSERDIKRATALETLHVLADGSQVQTKGFSVVDRFCMDRKSKNLISYCSNNTINNDIIFSVQPKETNWVISSTECLNETIKVPSSISDILSKKMLGCRYFVEVHEIKSESQITVKDSQGHTINFVIGKNSCINLDQPVPFFLDGAYFYDGKLFSDEHTRLVLKT